MKKGILISISLNILLLAATISLLLGKGITLENHSHNHQHNEQFQGQLMMNFMLHKGNKIEWKEISFNTRQEGLDFLNTLPPQESYFVKVIHPGINKFRIIYPKFFEKK